MYDAKKMLPTSYCLIGERLSMPLNWLAVACALLAIFIFSAGDLYAQDDPTSCSLVVTLPALPSLPYADANVYSLQGTVTYSGAPALGNLVLRVVGGPSQIFDVVSSNSPQSFTINGLYADGSQHEVVAFFSDDTSCSKSETYTAPAPSTVLFPLNTTIASVTYGGSPNIGLDITKVRTPGSPSSDKTLVTRLFDLDITTSTSVSLTNYVGFCSELAALINPGTTYTNEYKVIPLENDARATAGSGDSRNIPSGGIGLTKAGQIRYLFDEFFHGTGPTDWVNISATAFQFALWDITHDHYNGSPLTVKTGSPSQFNFYRNGGDNLSAIDDAESILSQINNLNWSEEQWQSYVSTSWHVIALESDASPNHQDMLVAVPISEPPTATTIALFNATGNESSIDVMWATVSEETTDYFNLFRSTSADELGSQINAEPIAAQNAGLPEGATYEFADADVVSGVQYFYTLEIWDIDGTFEHVGPVLGVLENPTAVTTNQFTATSSGWPRSALLAAGLLALAGIAIQRRRKA